MGWITPPESMAEEKHGWIERQRWHTRTVSRADVQQHFANKRSDIVEQAANALKGDTPVEADLISQLFECKLPHERFEALDNHMRQQGVECLLATSRLNVQEMAAVPAMQRGPEVLALYRRGADQVTVLEATEAGNGETLEHFIRKHLEPGTRLAIEEQSMRQSQQETLGLPHDLMPAPGSQWLQIWREEIAAMDLPYVVIAAKIAAGALDQTLRQIQQELEKKQTVNEQSIADNLRANCMACYRTLVDEDGSSLMTSHNFIHTPALHALGLSIVLADKDGTIRAYAEAGRTLVMNQGIQHLYKRMGSIVRDHISPACHTIARGHDVFQAAKMKFIGEISAQENVGRVMGKQAWGQPEFSENTNDLLDTGMTGAVEMHCDTASGQLHYQDMFVTHPYKGLNLTKRHPFE